MGEDNKQKISPAEKKLSLSARMPRMIVLSSICFVLIFIFYFVYPISGINRASWSSGPVSNKHSMIESDCKTCHSVGFVQVQDKECLACHTMTDHAKSINEIHIAHKNFKARCAECHMEHNGDHGLIARDTILCADCHGKIKEILPNSKLVPVITFDSHPEFRIRFGENKTSLSDKNHLKDVTRIKLNHKVHLKPGLLGPQGAENLQCVDCHEPSSDLKSIKPINFERHCLKCHSLEFDSRLPNAKAPHGNSEIVYNYLYAEYAKLFLEKDSVKENVTQESIKRVKPGGIEVERGEKIEFARFSVEEQARSMEESLFTRTACHLCHVVEGVPGASKNKTAAFKVVEPNIPESWMPALKFNHGAHQEVRCESCHSGVSMSEQTSDVLLPGVQSCKQCHAETEAKDKVVSPCVMCHSFHEPVLMDEQRRRQVEDILFSQ